LSDLQHDERPGGTPQGRAGGVAAPGECIRRSLRSRLPNVPAARLRARRGPIEDPHRIPTNLATIVGNLAAVVGRRDLRTTTPRVMDLAPRRWRTLPPRL
jgi:hypothetical protein